MEHILEIKKTKGTPVKCVDCGRWTGAKGEISRDPRFALRSDEQPVCLDCADKYEWTEELMKERGYTYHQISPKVPDLDFMDEVVEPGFMKALKYSKYTQMAYLLGYQKGATDADGQ